MDQLPARSITESDLESMLLDEAAEPRALPFSLLENITNGFSDKQEIGRGGFAVVYKGMLENEVVAVKRLSNTYMYEKEFIREVECLMKAKHVNIVRFLGYCSDTQGTMQKFNGKLVMADVQERLLCFQYLHKGSLDGYIQDASGGLEWTTRYKIIKGICQGLQSLHHINILHLDLKPSNILMDDNLIPKITDFGLSRCFEEFQTRVIPTKMIGTMGYLAPEFTNNVITHKFDLYSLGVVITEILTGKKERQAIENILESWHQRLELSQRNLYCEQIKVCAEIGIECTNFDPTKRPISMKHVMDRLAEMESRHAEMERLAEIQRLAEMERLAETESKHKADTPDEKKILLLYSRTPPQLPTPQARLATLELAAVAMHLSAWPAPYTPPRRRGPVTDRPDEKKILEPILLKDFDYVKSMDAHPTEPWIAIGHQNGNCSVWNHDNKTMMASFKISEKSVYSVKFHATKKWIVAGSEDNFIHVYDCVCITQIQKITSLPTRKTDGTRSFSTHPTKPYVLSGASMKLWDGDRGWECTHTFRANTGSALAFNQDDPNSFACQTWYCEVEVWSLDPPKAYYTLKGHSQTVNCFCFFKRGDRQYLITGSHDRTAKIWDLQKRVCIRTLKDFTSPVMHVISIPGRPYLVTCLLHAEIHVWSSTNFRLKTKVNFRTDGADYNISTGLVCLMGSRRIAIGKQQGIYIMDIEDEEEAVGSEGKFEDFEYEEEEHPEDNNDLEEDEDGDDQECRKIRDKRTKVQLLQPLIDNEATEPEKLVYVPTGCSGKFCANYLGRD